MQIRRTRIYAEWFANLRDLAARAKITARIERLEIPGALELGLSN
jgi:putative component of toxin-antitoxin plasmid stabilization module